MWSLVASLRVVDALTTHHHHDAGELFAAILAGAIVFLLFLCDGAKVHVECAKSRQNFPRIHDVIIGCTQEDT